MNRVLHVAVSFLWVASLAAEGVLAGGVVRQLTSELTTAAAPGALDDAGTAIFTGASADLAGTNPGHAFQLWRFDPVTAAATQISAAPRGFAAIMSVSDDGQWLLLESTSDPVGTNPSKGSQLFLHRTDGRHRPLCPGKDRPSTHRRPQYL